MRSLQWRLAVPLSIFLALSLAALGAFMAVSYRNDQMDNIRQRLSLEATLVARAVLPYLPDSSRSDDLVKLLGQDTDIRLTVIGIDGTVLGDSLEDPRVMDNHLSRPEVQQAIATGYGESTRYSTTLNYDMLYVAIAIRDNAGQTTGVSRVALPVSAVSLTTGRMLGTVALALAVVLGVIVTGVWLVSRAVTGPVRQLTRDVNRLAGGEVGLTTAVHSGDELGTLARAFNAMSLQLAGTFEQLEADKNRLSAILCHIADGVVLCDIDSRLVLANRAAARIFDFNEQDASGRPVIEALRDYEIDEIMRRARADNREVSAQFESLVNRRYLQAIAVPLSYDQSRGLLLLFQDLTELRNLQTMRKELIGNISHEFRTPLAGIRAIVETLEGGALKETEVARDFLGKIRSEVDRLTHMVSELTELSRIETGRSDLIKERLDLNSLAAQEVERFSPLAARSSLLIEARLDEKLPEVIADREKLRQALSNLLHNAIKFTPPGGRITVSSRLENRNAVMSVSDTGVGIAPDDLPHVFERFFKADRARSGGGTGLGLAIVKHTIQAHGGRVWAESYPGKGSTFSFSLPVG